MKRLSLLAALLVLGLAGSLMAQDYAPDRIIVKGATQAQLAALGGVGVKSVSALGIGAMQLVNLKPGLSPVAAAALLQAQPNVEFACLDYVRTINAVRTTRATARSGAGRKSPPRLLGTSPQLTPILFLNLSEPLRWELNMRICCLVITCMAVLLQLIQQVQW